MFLLELLRHRHVEEARPIRIELDVLPGAASTRSAADATEDPSEIHREDVDPQPVTRPASPRSEADPSRSPPGRRASPASARPATACRTGRSRRRWRQRWTSPGRSTATRRRPVPKRSPSTHRWGHVGHHRRPVAVGRIHDRVDPEIGEAGDAARRPHRWRGEGQRIVLGDPVVPPQKRKMALIPNVCCPESRADGGQPGATVRRPRSSSGPRSADVARRVRSSPWDGPT